MSVDVTHWRGHRLPLRLEINGDRKVSGGLESVVWWFELRDEDHRPVEPHIGDFEQCRQIMEQANATMIRHTRVGPIDEKYGGICHRRVELHPVRGYHGRTQLAFECLALFAHGTPTTGSTLTSGTRSGTSASTIATESSIASGSSSGGGGGHSKTRPSDDPKCSDRAVLAVLQNGPGRGNPGLRYQLTLDSAGASQALANWRALSSATLSPRSI